MHVMVHLCYMLTEIILRPQKGHGSNGSDKDMYRNNDENINCID